MASSDPPAPARSRDARQRAWIGDGLLLLDRGAARLALLSPTASIVLESLEAGLAPAAMAASIGRRFGLKRESVLAEVEALLASLRDTGRHPPPGPPPAIVCPDSARPARFDELLDLSGRLVRVRSHAERAGAWLLDKVRHRRVPAGLPSATIEIVATDRPRSMALLQEGMPPVHVGTRRDLAGHLYQMLVAAAHPGRRFLAFLHAAAVVRSGRSVLLAGASGSGKSTLTARLVLAGAAYLGDELIGVAADDLSLCPLPTALALKPAGWPAASALLATALAGRDPPHARHGVRYIDPAIIGVVAARGPAAAALVFPCFEAAAPPRVEPLSPEQALRRLLDEGLGLGAPPVPSLPGRLAAWLQGMPAWELTYGDGAWAWRWIEGLLEERP